MTYHRLGAVLLIFLIVLPLSLGVMAQPAVANSCRNADARSIQFHNGYWWILVSLSEEAPGEVYQFSQDWTVVNRYQIGFDINQTSNETNAWTYRYTSIARGPDGGWWVLARRGTVYRFTDGWNYTGEKQTLSGPDYDTYDIARVNDSWLLLSGDSVWQYTDSWTDSTTQDFSSHVGFSTIGLAGNGHNVWTVDSNGSLLSEGTVNRFTPTTGAADEFDHDYQRELDWETSRPTDIAAGPDGNWIVLEDDGGVVPYTGYWQYMGSQREVTEAIGYCGFTFVSLGYYLFGPLFVALILIGLFTAWIRYQPQTQYVAGCTGVAGATISLVYAFYLLSPPLSIIYWPPDILISAAFAVFLVSTLALVRAAEDSKLGWDMDSRDLVGSLRGPGLIKDVIILCLIQSPVLCVLFAFLI